MKITFKTQKIPFSIYIPLGVLKLKIIKNKIYKEVEEYIEYKDYISLYNEILKNIKLYKGLELVNVYVKDDNLYIIIKI